MIRFDWDLVQRVGMTESRVLKKRYESKLKNTEFVEVDKDSIEKQPKPKMVKSRQLYQSL